MLCITVNKRVIENSIMKQNIDIVTLWKIYIEYLKKANSLKVRTQSHKSTAYICHDGWVAK